MSIEAQMTLAQAERGGPADDGALDTVALAGGRTLTVRPVRYADAGGLNALFEGLSDDDRYFRFFGMSHPGSKFIEHLTRAAEEGGWRLVAVVSRDRDAGNGAAVDPQAAGGDAGDGAADAGGEGRGSVLVAEAGYAMLPSGNGEFALTIAAGWRGWLGPYLLDRLVAGAAACGVPRLEADIMTGNRRMLSLVADRGYVTLDRQGSEIRVAVAAARPCPRS